MKKTTKLFAGVALAAMLLTTGCNSNSGNNQPGNFRQQDIYQLYKVAGGTMSYQEWLDTIRGADGSQFYADGVDPNDASGKDGDVFVNIASWNFFLKIGGSWRNLGCLKGAQGEQGPQGPKGDQGEQGPKGDPGSQIYADGSDPAANSGAEGDVFFNIATWDVFMKLNGAWVKIGNIKGADGQNGQDGANGGDGYNGVDGAPGADGSQIYADAVDPNNNSGKDSDIFFNIATWDVFMKLDGSWHKIGNVKGADGLDGKDGKDGQDGASVLYGFGYPSNDLGKDGDSYIDLNNMNFYGKSNGVWAWLANIRENVDRWSPAVSAEMWEYIGQELPFVALNEDTMYHEFTDAYYDYGFGLYIIGDDNENNLLENYEWKLLDDGWVKDENAEFGDYVKDTQIGRVELSFEYFEATADYEAGNEIDVYLPVPAYTEEELIAGGLTKVQGWPADIIELAFFEENVFGPVNEDGDWFVDYETYEGSGSHVGQQRTTGILATEGDFVEEVEDALFAAGFIWEDYWEDYELPDDYLTYMYIEFDRGFTFIDFYGSYKPIEVEPHTAEEASAAIVDFYANQDMVVDVPEYAVASSDAYFGIKEQPAIDGLEVDVYESDWDEMFEFALAMEEAGWTVDDGAYEGDYVAVVGFEDGSFAQIDIQDWTAETGYGCIRLICTYGVPAEFPADEIAAFLAGKGVTDVLPPYSGVALDYIYVTSGTQLQVQVTPGTEAAAIARYQADLLAANYVEAGADQYGDMHYTSPNEQLDVCAWNGVDIGNDGWIYIDLEVLVAQPAPTFTSAYELICEVVVASGGGNYPASTLEQYGYIYDIDEDNDVWGGESVVYWTSDYSADYTAVLNYFMGSSGRFPDYLQVVSGPTNTVDGNNEPIGVALAVTGTTANDFGVMLQAYVDGGATYISFLAAPLSYFVA